jgi:hypothetical protein
MTTPGQPGAAERVWQRVQASPRAALEHGLSPADLQALLMTVSRRRAQAVAPARLMQRWREDRFVQPAASDPRLVWPLEARLWALLPEEFTAVDLSPVTPLGTCSAMAPVDQHRVISTIRGSEVVSDPTNVLALAAALRRQRPPTRVVHLAACHRVLRGQRFDAPGAFPHFRLFALVSSARDRGSAATEAAMLTIHLRFWAWALSDLLPGLRVAARFTVFGFPPLAERVHDTVLPALRPLPEGVIIEEDPGRERARGYYARAAIRLDIGVDAAGHEVGDGGFTDWTAQLMNDAKERCLISCVATERLAELSASSQPADAASTPTASRPQAADA